MSGRSNWEYKNAPAPVQVADNSVLDRLPPGMRAEAEARAAAKANRPTNEAIKVSAPAAPKSTLDKGLDANRGANASKGRGQYINDMVDKASR